MDLHLLLSFFRTGISSCYTCGAAVALGARFLLASIGLSGEGLGAEQLCFGFVNVFHENALVLELITLRFVVQRVVEVFVNLLGLAVPETSHILHRAFIAVLGTRNNKHTCEGGDGELACGGSK